MLLSSTTDRHAARKLVICLAIAVLALTGCAQERGGDQEVSSASAETSAPLETLKPDPDYAATRSEPYAWAKEPKQFAHGLGGVDGYRSTESFEAFKANYDRGFRVFEVDLVRTTDGALVARHDWEPYLYEFLGQRVGDPKRRMSLAEFRRTKIHGTLTPLAFTDIVAIMKAYPDVYFITDTKEKEPALVEESLALIDEAIGSDVVLKDRLIIQIYNEPMLRAVRDKHGFRNVIYTLYMLEGTFERAVDFARRNGVLVVAMSDTQWTPDRTRMLIAAGLKPAVFTVNDRAIANKMRRSGVDFFYTDFMPPVLPPEAPPEAP